MRRILFVCTGNTCRSPMAAALMNKLLRERGNPGAVAESAGLAACGGEPASANAVQAAAEAGADLNGHRARRVNRELLEQADMIFAMTPAHASALAAEFPELSGRVRVLGGGIPDPYGGNMEVYRACRDAIWAALNTVAEECSQ